MAVTDLINDARGYASQILNSADTAFKNAVFNLDSIGFAFPVWTNVNNPSGSVPDASSLLGSAPDLSPPSDPAWPSDPISSTPLNPPPTINPGDGFPHITRPPTIDASLFAPDLQAIEPINIPEPEFIQPEPIDTSGKPDRLDPGIRPTYTAPDRPLPMAAFSGQAPSINTSISFPAPPAELINPNITPPEAGSHVRPTRPSVVVPSFDGIAPSDTPSLPSDLASQGSAVFSSTSQQMRAALQGEIDAALARINPQYHQQMAAIESQLTRYLQGGTGLDKSVENAIYERAKDKQQAEFYRVQQSAWGDAAARGFTLPTGSALTALQMARQGAADNNTRAAIEIAINQAELEQKNLQFAVTTSTNLRTAVLGVMMSYHQNLVSLNGQALDYAKFTVGNLVEIFNASVKLFEVKMDGYKAEASVYSTRLQAALAAFDIYKAELQGYESELNADRLAVDIYRTRMESMNTLANVYRAQIEAVSQQANMEKLKLELFSSQVQAYSAEVSAKDGEYRAYSSAVQGELAGIQAYTQQVQGYTAEVNAYNAVVQAGVTVQRTQLEMEQAKLAIYKSKADVKIEANKAVVMNNQAQIERQKASLESQEANVRAATTYGQGQIALYTAQMEAKIKDATAQMQWNTTQLETERNQYAIYKAKVDKESDLLRLKYSFSEANARRWQTEVSARTEAARFALARWQAEASVQIENSKGNLSAQISATDSQRNFRKDMLALTAQNMQTIGQTAASALAGMNSLVAETGTGG